MSGLYSVLARKIEGGSDRVFKFTFNNNRRLIAKLPFKGAGPAYLTTASEVATIEYRKLKWLIDLRATILI
ncbi:hypothetical protein N7540_003461 [Penicillium herquei]|nr:hypothetical protein N7540_003461 [Penicillium herquei]